MPSDAQLMCYVRRVNLDIFWSREPSTVATSYRSILKGKRMSEQLGLAPIPLKMGPWPIGDKLGFQIAIEILRASKLPGRNASTYSQFDSIRKIRSGYLNCLDCEPSRVLDMKTLKTDKGQYLTHTNSPTQSKLFTMFMKGCEKRMGRLVKQDMGLSLPVLMEILRIYDEDLERSDLGQEEKRARIICGAAFTVLWAGALRGGEVLLMEASELVTRRKDGLNDKNGHVVVPLMGRFKGETGERNMLIVLANVSRSGLNIRKWVDRLSALLVWEEKAAEVGPAICDNDGTVYSSSFLNENLHSVLEIIQHNQSGLIPLDIDVVEKYSTYRSFRRGATTHAQEQQVPISIIEMNNRWRKVERRQGSLPRLPMTQLYLEITQVLKTKLQFSQSL